MLAFMGENKRLVNIHEQKFVELAAFQVNTTVFQANTNPSLKNLETQVRQLDLTMQNQSKDSFPSDTRKNPKDCMAVTPRSGRELEEKRVENKDTEEEKYVEIGQEFKQHSSETTEEEKTVKMQPEQQVEKENRGKREEVKDYNPQVPFPQRLQKAKLEDQFFRFLNMFKKIEINIPYSKVLTQMHHYAKFMKKILSKKRNIAEEGIVSLTATSSAVSQNSLLEKMQDPGSFTIPCKIGHANMGKALCDFRASINLMSSFVAKRLSLGELTPSAMTLQMADITLAYPEGILEDVLTKVGKFIFSNGLCSH